MLLPRRARDQVARPRARAAFPEWPYCAAGRLVAARRGPQTAADVARRGRREALRMAAAEDTVAPRPTDAVVDVLIIGSGASGAAVAWGLGETRMRILCLEQGDW